MKLISWNVNGLRSAMKSGFIDFLAAEQPEMVCLQEIKCTENVVEPLWAAHYATFWNPAEKKGYSGTALFTRPTPRQVAFGLALDEPDLEGRVITAEYDDFFLVTVYAPNSKDGLTRLPYRQQWDEIFLRYTKSIERNKPVIICGDLNVAHTELDIAHPERHARTAGFTREERAGFSRLVEAGFIDTFREFEKGGGHYTWWSNFANARSRNLGWRIDYFLISPALRPRLRSAFILPAVGGSDHCPVGIELER
jgi:exodeoxyribonuclease-3